VCVLAVILLPCCHQRCEHVNSCLWSVFSTFAFVSSIFFLLDVKISLLFRVVNIVISGLLWHFTNVNFQKVFRILLFIYYYYYLCTRATRCHPYDSLFNVVCWNLWGCVMTKHQVTLQSELICLLLGKLLASFWLGWRHPSHCQKAVKNIEKQLQFIYSQ